jgi:hypothetical protein
LPGGLRELADHANLQNVHWAMENYAHLAAAYRGGRMHLSGRPGLGVTLMEQARGWTVDSSHIDKPR